MGFVDTEDFYDLSFRAPRIKRCEVKEEPFHINIDLICDVLAQVGWRRSAERVRALSETVQNDHKDKAILLAWGRGLEERLSKLSPKPPEHDPRPSPESSD